MESKTIKLLLLEDDTAHTEAILRALKATRYKVRVAGTLREYHDNVAADPPDIALLDMFLPDGGAMEVLSSHEQENPFPLLIMTSHGNEQYAVDAMKAGALDYIVKSPEAFADMPNIITHAIGHWRLLQERKWGEEELRKSELRYRDLVNNSKNAVAIYEAAADGEDFIIKDFNSAAENIEKVKKEDIIGKSILQVFPGVKEFGFFDVFQRVWRTGVPEHFPITWYQDERISGWRDNYVYRLSSGEIVAIYEDVTARKQAEKAVQESEEKYRMVVENAQEAIFIAADGMIKFANSRATELSGYSMEEFRSMPFIEFFHPDDRRMITERYLRWLEGMDVPTTDAVRIILKQEDTRWAELSIVAITWEGKPATLAFLTDITDRKQLEEEQQRVDKLESVGLLAGGIAHDFNNILTSILGNISLARMEAAPGSELLNSLEQAEKASQRAKALTVQLLTFSKGGAPVLKLASLTELLKDTAGFAMSGSRVKCNFSIPDDLWHADVDAGQVSQVIHNLVINAQQAMPAGGSIEINAENIALSKTQSLGRGLPLKEGDYVRIAVTDHGIGIPEDHLEKIFDPFFTTKQKGNGMGLAISFSIAHQHGGHISVESELGTGSTFYLYLPASTATFTPELAEKKAIKPAARARILVMDDEKGVREIASRMLKHIGYKDVEFAADGAEAIKLYKEAMKADNPFNIAVLDLTIAGGMGGEETIRKLLKLDPGVKAIVSSGYIDDPVIAKFREYGFSGMVAKPYTIAELRKAVQDVIG